MGDTRNYAALDWVIGEISETLNDARQALEAYVEDPKDSTRIRFCLNYIHQVHGSLRLVEFQGAALFAEEMELLVDAMRTRNVANEKEAQEVLMRSLLQLPIYLDQVKAYHEDHAGIVLPLLNDVRAARKQPYLSETNLFNPNMAAAKKIRGEKHDVLKDTAKVKHAIKKLREMYQYAAASVLRGIKVDENLGYLDKVFTRIEGIARGTASHPLWFVSAALIEALIRDDVELSVAVRGLLRYLARELQILETHCPQAFDGPPRDSLLRNLLYYVACAEPGGKRVDMVKKQYALDNALLGGTMARAALRQGLISAPDDNAIKAVAVALQDELNTVKHLLDLVLNGQGGESDLSEMLPIVKRIGDTLAVMGIPEMRDQMVAHHDVLKSFCDKGQWSETDLIEVAGKIADIENRLQAIAKGSSKNRNLAQLDEREVEIDSAKEAVLEECRTGLNQIRDAIVAGTNIGWDEERLTAVVDMFHNIQGGLNIVPLPRAAAIIDACGKFTKTAFSATDDPSQEQLVLLAEAIESVDYYLESVGAGHVDNIDRYLNMAIENLAKLDSPVDSKYANTVEQTASAEVPVEPEPSGSPITEPEAAETEPSPEPLEAPIEDLGESLETLGEVESDTAPVKEEAEPELALQAEDDLDDIEVESAEEPESSMDLAAEADNDIDDEILEIFIEEAQEVQETLAEFFPQWVANRNDQEALTVTRRSFHTLKGSGRMVKAMDVGELAWSVENMLNRVIDETITADDNVIKIIELVLDLVPTLVKAFEEKKPNPEKALTEQYIGWANQLAKGNVPADFPGDGAAPAEVQADLDESDEEEDKVLWEIFASEAKTHLDEVDQFIADMEYAAPIYDIPTDHLQRALHTLKGSAHMAGVAPIASLIAPLERFVKELRSYQVKVDGDILQLIKDAASYTHNGIEAIDQDESVMVPKLDQFLARVKELNDQHIAPLIHMREQNKSEGDAKVDPRLLSIFMAEEMRLLLDADEVIAPWQNNQPADEESLASLVSELSTLSEGADQANLPLMSKLSAEMKSVFEGVQAGRLQQTESLHDIVKPAHEYLLDMVDAVAAGQTMLPVSEKLQTQIDDLLAQTAEPLDVIDDASTLEESADADADLHSQTIDFTAGEDTEESADTIDYADFMAANEYEEVSQSSIIENTDDSDEAASETEEPVAEDNLAEQSIFESDDGVEPEIMDLDSEPQALDDELMDEGELTEAFDMSGLSDDAEMLEAHSSEEVADEHEEHEQPPLAEQTSTDEQTEIVDTFDAALEQDATEEAELTLDADEPTLETIEFETSEDRENSEDNADIDTAFEFDITDSGEQPAETPEELTLEEPEPEDDSIPDFILDSHVSKPEDEVAASAGEAATESELGPEHIAYIATDDFDRDILEIFLEEANELIEELDEAVHDWESDWNNEEAKDTMLRALHTVKGGARLSGIKNVGELVHNYETYLIATKSPDKDPDFFKNVHAYQDRFHYGIRAVTAVLNGEPLPEEKSDSTDTLPENVEVSEEERLAVLEKVVADTAAAKSADREKSTKSAEIVPFGQRKQGDVSETLAERDQPSTQAPVQQPVKRQGNQEMVKVSAELLEELVNLAGETSISRGRLEQQISDLSSAVEDVDGTLGRLQEQLRRLDQETEAQVLFRQEQMAQHEEFDPLEMDRYSHLQQLSRSLMESASDLLDLKSTLTDKIRDTETLLLQQSRVNSSLQEGLMRTRMVPFSRLVPRLRRIVRQVAAELGKHVNFELDNVEGEMDRSVLERMVAPLEHMLRNAVDHGLESPSDRLANGKAETGRILLSLSREGGDILLRLADDGRGININRVKDKAVESGLMAPDAELTDHEIMQFILQAGFSTAESVTQISGRGVGMDVVSAEIKQLGGTIVIDSKQGVGTQFTVRLPFTVSVNRALMVQLGSDTFAIPLNTIEGIVRVSPFELEHYYSHPDARFEYAGENYQVRHVGAMLNPDMRPKLDGQLLPLPVILVRTAQHTMALQVDALMGSREIVVKTLGPQFAAVQGISGATVMGDGSVVIIVDPHALMRREIARASLAAPQPTLIEKPGEQYESNDGLKTIMVVDDSVTVRKVTTRFLEREGYAVITAKDGVDALQVLQDETPDLMLLDIEMPRMDGFEVARNMRNTSTLKHIPIIMITSRTGDKHRQHALSIGVNEYMGKPYQEDVLLKTMRSLLGEKATSA